MLCVPAAFTLTVVTEMRSTGVFSAVIPFEFRVDCGQLSTDLISWCGFFPLHFKFQNFILSFSFSDFICLLFQLFEF